MQILFLAPRHPWPAERGDQRRALHLVEELARRADVTLLCFGGRDAAPVEGVRTITVRRGALGIATANLRSPRPIPLQARLYLDAAMRRAVAGQLRHRPPDVVHVTLARMAPYLPPPGPWHRHLDLVDALSLNMATRARAAPAWQRPALAREARLLRRYEAACVAAADSSSLVSAADRAAAPGLSEAAVLPNGVDTARFPFAAPEDRPPVVLFFGNLGYFHNVAPAVFLAREVLPRLRERVPRATLRLAGARPAAAVRRLGELPGVEVAGPVPDMGAELRGAAVAAVPMFTGSGIKNKVLEAFSSGTPVVANRLGLQGVEGARDGRDHLEGETADELADACATLLADPDRRVAIAEAARTLVEDRYAWGHIAERLLALYGERAASHAQRR